MTFICFERADALHAQQDMLANMKVSDGASLCAYLQGYWQLIYNHKMLGCVYNIYADEAVLARENGFRLKGIAQIEHEIMNLTAAFPDLQIDIADIFAVADSEGKYKVWMRYYFAGTNTAYSLYGAPTGLSLDIKKSLSMSVFHMEDIEGEWLITAEETMHPCDYIRAICTDDSSFTNLQL